MDRIYIQQFVISDLSRLIERGLEDIPDNRIVQGAFNFISQSSGCRFWTEDFLCLTTANLVYQLSCKTEESSSSVEYTGWIDEDLTDEQIAAIYEHPTENSLSLAINQYAVIRGANDVVEAVKWDGNSYVRVKIPAIKSKFYGTVRPYAGDIYQQMALDSLSTNQVTMLKGHAGTGKSYLALGYLFYLLEKGKIDKIIVFANPVAVGDACQLGFYPGTR